MAKGEAQKADAEAEAALAAAIAKAEENVMRRRRIYGEDWGQWIATEDIYHDGALAYKKGHPVPNTNVQLHGYDKTDPPQVKPVE